MVRGLACGVAGLLCRCCRAQQMGSAELRRLVSGLRQTVYRVRLWIIAGMVQSVGNMVLLGVAES